MPLSTREKQRRVLLVAGPQGVGKTYLAKQLVERNSDFVIAPGVVTRSARSGQDGNDTQVNPAHFQRMSDNGELCLVASNALSRPGSGSLLSCSTPRMWSSPGNSGRTPGVCTCVLRTGRFYVADCRTVAGAPMPKPISSSAVERVSLKNSIICTGA